MVQRTYGDIRESLAEIAGTSGMPVTDVRIRDQLNLAQEEIISEGEFPGVVDRWKIVSDGSGVLVLPSHLDRLMQITLGGAPAEIKSPWFSFVAYGPGIQDDARFEGCDLAWGDVNFWRGWAGPGNILEVGEKPVKRDLPDILDSTLVGPWFLRVYADPSTNETPGIFLLAQGTDAMGNVIRTTINNGSGAEYINGERIAISSGSAFAESLQQYAGIDTITKPVTNGPVRLTAWNGSVEIELSNYQFDETTPSYHHYFSPWLRRVQDRNPCCRTVIARCRRRFVPVREDSDKLIISNLPALRQMVRAIWKRDASAIDEYAALKTTAVDLLNKEAMAYRGKVRTPALVFQRGYPAGYLPHVR